MAYVQTRQVSAGQLLSGTFEELVAIKRELAIYFALFIAAGVMSDFLGVLALPITLATTVGYFVGQYWLFRAALGQQGLGDNAAQQTVLLFCMALLLGFGLYIGFSIFVIPGILLGAKWIMAPAYLVDEENKLFDAIGASWRASDQNLLPLSIAYGVIWLIWVGLFFLITALSGGIASALYSTGLGGVSNGLTAFTWIIFHLLPVMLLGLSVTAYRALGDSEDALVAVFE